MLLRRLTVQNYRSFLDKTIFETDGLVSIIIGPNGGGKTNLLDAVVIMLRRYIFATRAPVHIPQPTNPDLWEFRPNDSLNNMHLEKYAGHEEHPQLIELEVEVTHRDVEVMASMKAECRQLLEFSKSRYTATQLDLPERWELEIRSGDRVKFRLENGIFHPVANRAESEFLEYLHLYELDNLLREEFDLSQLATPMMYFPVNRSSGGFNSTVELANYDHFAQKRQYDSFYSKNAGSGVAFAIGRLAQRFRTLLERDNGSAKETFRSDPNVMKLTAHLHAIGYDWDLRCTNPNKNRYDVLLKKQGTAFRAAAASSGELELLTYLFAIFALNVRDALVIIDEPELHLHPTWQKVLLELFVSLAEETGNQFIMATHSPSFISPQSIPYVTRVFSRDQQSRIVRLETGQLPDAKHLLNIVNSENNERLFFADKVILVEGLSDRIFFESLLNSHGRKLTPENITEVICVHGKGLFDAYARILSAFKINHYIVADRDYIEQIGWPQIKKLFQVNAAKVKENVIDNATSYDGATLVKAIDEAMATGSWQTATGIWDYIKARHSRLPASLSNADQAAFNGYISSMRVNGIFLLREGSLEDYLPPGYRNKDIQKLIKLLEQPNYLDQIPADRKNELRVISELLLSGTALGSGWPMPPLFMA